MRDVCMTGTKPDKKNPKPGEYSVGWSLSISNKVVKVRRLWYKNKDRNVIWQHPEEGNTKEQPKITLLVTYSVANGPNFFSKSTPFSYFILDHSKHKSFGAKHSFKYLVWNVHFRLWFYNSLCFVPRVIVWWLSLTQDNVQITIQ